GKLGAGSGGAPESVHLANCPAADAAALDRSLNEAMRPARAFVALGRTARSKSRIRTRQPLQRALLHPYVDRLEPLLPLVADELNVKTVEFAETAEQLAAAVGVSVPSATSGVFEDAASAWRAKPNFRRLGPR